MVEPSVNIRGNSSSVIGVKESMVPLGTEFVCSPFCASFILEGTVVREVVYTFYKNTTVT